MKKFLEAELKVGEETFPVGTEYKESCIAGTMCFEIGEHMLFADGSGGDVPIDFYQGIAW